MFDEHRERELRAEIPGDGPIPNRGPDETFHDCVRRLKAGGKSDGEARRLCH